MFSLREEQNTIDARVQSDLEAGRFDSAIQRALNDEKKGRVQPLRPLASSRAGNEMSGQ